jgi:hypothetical protein
MALRAWAYGKSSQLLGFFLAAEWIFPPKPTVLPGREETSKKRGFSC